MRVRGRKKPARSLPILKFSPRRTDEDHHHPIGREKGPAQKTPFIILAAAFNAILYRYTGQSDIVISYPVNLRPRNRKFNFLSGFMANQVLLRTAIPENTGFGSLVEGIAGQRQADRLHQQ